MQSSMTRRLWLTCGRSTAPCSARSATCVCTKYMYGVAWAYKLHIGRQVMHMYVYKSLTSSKKTLPRELLLFMN